MTQNVTALFGMPGFEVRSTEMVDGEWHVGIETPRDLVGCGDCGAVARVKDRRTVTVRDLPASGVPVVIRWRKRIFECRYALCPNKTWTELHPAIAPRAVLTDRARQWGFEEVGHHDRAVAPVAATLGVSWHTIMRQVTVRGNPLVDDPERLDGVSAAGVDETAFLRACSTHPTLHATGIADLTPGRLRNVTDTVVTANGTRVPGLRLEQQRSHALLTALPIFRLQPDGFSNRDLRPLIAQLRGMAPREITTGQMTYDLRRLRLHGLIQRIPHTHRYRVTDTGLESAMFLSTVHDRLLPTGLANLATPTPTRLRSASNTYRAAVDDLTRRVGLAA